MWQFRLQFLFRTTDHATIVLDEREVRSADVSAAIHEIADIVWPTHATGLRLMDLDGRVVHEESRADVGTGRTRARLT